MDPLYVWLRRYWCRLAEKQHGVLLHQRQRGIWLHIDSHRIEQDQFSLLIRFLHRQSRKQVKFSIDMIAPSHGVFELDLPTKGERVVIKFLILKFFVGVNNILLL